MTKNKALDIAFLGIDGIGKSTIINHIVPIFKKKGLSAKVVTWRRAIGESDDDFSRDTLRDLYVGTFRTMFGWANDDTHKIRELFPASSEEFMRCGVEGRLGELSIQSNETKGLFATALIELAGNFILKDHEVERYTKDHDIVIQETFGFKHIVKELLIAKEIVNRDERDVAEKAIQDLLDLASASFSHWLQPKVGFFVKGDPEVAYSWRLRQSGRVGVIEDFGLASQTGMKSFVSLQSECNKIFEEFAKQCKWPVIEMKDRSIEENLDNACSVIFDEIGCDFGTVLV